MNKVKAECELKSAIDEIRKLFSSNDKSYSNFTSSNQLLNFIKQFELAIANITNNSIPPKNERSLGIAKMVTDQWPFDFELGESLISAEQAYKDI